MKTKLPSFSYITCINRAKCLVTESKRSIPLLNKVSLFFDRFPHTKQNLSAKWRRRSPFPSHPWASHEIFAILCCVLIGQKANSLPVSPLRTRVLTTTKKEIWNSNYYFPENPFGNYKMKNFQFLVAHKEERIVHGKLHVVRSTGLFWQMVSTPRVATPDHPEVRTRVGHSDWSKSSAYKPMKLYKHF